MTRWIFLVLALMQQPETLSLLGQPLYAPRLPKAERAKAEEALAAARAAYDTQRSEPPAILAFARATVAVGHVGDALEILTHGLEARPDDPGLLFERGRGYILIRKFEAAQRDLRKAAAALPDANCALGLALYLSADFARARESYAKCAQAGVLGGLADRRAGASTQTPASPGDPPPPAPPPLRFPGSVARTDRDRRAAPAIAESYTNAIAHLLAGDGSAATEELKKIVEKNRNEWMDPVYIAAEADYARLYKPARSKKKKTT
jgi:tetratricopeptide (TPR) repeat protein